MGHGHVKPNPDGSKARCGGPGLCDECSKEYAGEHEGELRDIYSNLRRQLNALVDEMIGLGASRFTDDELVGAIRGIWNRNRQTAVTVEKDRKTLSQNYHAAFANGIRSAIRLITDKQGPHDSTEIDARVEQKLLSELVMEISKHADEVENLAGLELTTHVDRSQKIVILRALLDGKEAKIKSLISEDTCDVCLGNGDPLTGLPCMCRGTGRMSEAARYLREVIHKLNQEKRNGSATSSHESGDASAASTPKG